MPYLLACHSPYLWVTAGWLCVLLRGRHAHGEARPTPERGTMTFHYNSASIAARHSATDRQLLAARSGTGTCARTPDRRAVRGFAIAGTGRAAGPGAQSSLIVR